jgi:hypothetical protein
VTIIADASIGLGSSAIEDTIGSAAASICDEAVTIHGSTTEPRYRAWGTFDLSERPGDRDEGALVAMSGRVQQGRRQVADLCRRVARSGLAFRRRLPRGHPVQRAAFAARYLQRGEGHVHRSAEQVAADGLPSVLPLDRRGYAQDDYLLEDGGVRIWRDVEFRFVKWASTCQRLAKLELESTRRQGSAVFPFKLSGYLAAPPDVIAVRHARFGWMDKTFEVTDFETSISDGEDGSPKIGTTATVVETDADVYAWTAADDVAQNVAADIPLPVAQNEAPATSLTAANHGGGSVTLHWPTATDDAVYSDGTWTIQYKLHSASLWTTAGTVSGDSTSIDLSLTAAAYDFQIRSRSGDNIPSAWTQLLNWTVT